MGLKSVSVWMMQAFLFMLITIGGISLVQAATETSTACYGVEGQTTMMDGAAANENEGQNDFEYASPANAYKACLHEQSDFTSSLIDLKGWVWNHNLGWVSLNSEDPDGDGNYENLGVSTGTMAYGSQLDLSTSDDESAADYINAELKGYWWGDNLGWLSLNCADTADNCATVNYKTYVNSVVNPNTENAMATLGGYAWSTAHGWVNMTGVDIPLGHLYAEAIPSVSFLPVSEEIVDGERIVRADGMSGYIMSLSFKDSDGVVIPANTLPAGFDFCFIWDDKRYLDYEKSSIEMNPDYVAQTECFADSHAPDAQRFDLPNKALTKTNFKVLGLSLVSKYTLNSFVPSSGDEFVLNKVVVNNSKEYNMTNKKLVYKPPYELRLFQETPADGFECLEYEPEENVMDLTLGFNDSVAACGEYKRSEAATKLSEELNVNLEYEVQGEADDKTVFATLFGLTPHPYLLCPIKASEEVPEDIDSNWLREDDLGQSISDVLPVAEYVMHLGFRDVMNHPSVCEEQEEVDTEIYDADSILEDASMSLIASYTYSGSSGKEEVTRKGASIERPDFSVSAAQIAGSIQGDAIQIFKDNTSVSSSEKSDRVQQRTSLLKDLTNLAKGRAVKCKFSNLDDFKARLSSRAFEDCELDGTGMYVLEVNANAILKVVEQAGGDENSALKNLPALKYSDLLNTEFKDGNKTLLLVGTSLIIDKDVYKSGSPDMTKGIVVMKNSAGTGGHIYIKPNVTDIRAHIYADGSIYSVDDDFEFEKTDKKTGFPVDGYTPAKSQMRNQLFFSGQITSQNTYGGALSATPRLGDGTFVDPSQLDKAKWQDLNFWRYSASRLDWQGPDGAKELHLCGQRDYWLKDGEDGDLTIGGEVLPNEFYTYHLVSKDMLSTGVSLAQEVFANLFITVPYLSDGLPASAKVEFQCWDGSLGNKAVMAGERDYNVAPVVIKYALPPKDLPLFN